ncbi:MAG: AMP-binding protein [Myxococcota bacterium]
MRGVVARGGLRVRRAAAHRRACGARVLRRGLALTAPDLRTSVGSLLRDAVGSFGERPAVVETLPTRRCHTAASLDLGARRVAARLLALGVGPGARVGLQMENSAAFVAAWFGVIYAGATVVPLPVKSTRAEVAVRAKTAALGVVLAAPGGSAADGGGWLTIDPHEAAGSSDSAVPIEGIVASSAGSDAMILFTSGTTTGARGVRISHGALLAHTRTLASQTLRLGPDDVLLGTLPLTHSYGIRMVMLMGLATGARVVFDGPFSASRSLQTIRDEAVTWVPAVPTMFAAWAAQPQPPPAPSLRWCLSAGAPLAPAILDAAEQRLGAEIRQGYGMTEATFSTVDAPPAARTAGSVGPAVPGVELRVVDEAGRPVPAGTVGEVRVRGPHQMSGYLGDEAGREPVDPDGFIRTGDLGALDAAGRLRVVDRTRDLIIRGGENVYPSEVEAHLATHPAVREVAVIGRPDAFFGEVVVAVLVVDPVVAVTADALIAFAAERLSPHKVPVAIVFVDAMPTGPSGKVLKRELRRRELPA